MSAAEVIRQFFHDKYIVRNLILEHRGTPNTFVREGEEIDVGQRAQRDADTETLIERLREAGYTLCTIEEQALIVRVEPKEQDR